MELIITSIVAFASTNIDDLFILILFFTNKQYRTIQVIIGQYAGIIALILLSLFGSLIGIVIDPAYIGILGLVPIYLGVKGLFRYFEKTRKSTQEALKVTEIKGNGSFASVAAITIANGADNIGIYIPLFATLSINEKMIMVSVFLLMVGCWCFTSFYMSKHPALAKAIDKHGHLVTPVILIALGAYIIYESNTIRLFY